MDIPANFFPEAYLWVAGVLSGLLMLAALLCAPWSKIRDGEAQHIFFGTVVMLSLLWMMRGGIQDGLGFHLLGMTLICLMFEWQFALAAASLVVAIATLAGPAAWEAFALNLLLMGALPITFTRLFLYFCQRRLPHNYLSTYFSMLFLPAACRYCWRVPPLPDCSMSRAYSRQVRFPGTLCRFCRC